jgi:GGDEF domain-containing protein
MTQGDELLKKTAPSLKNAAGDDIIARTGGDEFVILAKIGLCRTRQSFKGSKLSKKKA